MDNYIVINGKKAELTEEQLKALGIEIKKKTIFDREKGQPYYYVTPDGTINRYLDNLSGKDDCDSRYYNAANYCTNLEVMEHRALHETLNRLLWRFSMEHDGEKIDWKNYSQQKHYIRINSYLECDIGIDIFSHIGSVYFYTKDIAEQAIEEIVKPFIAKHPEFKW